MSLDGEPSGTPGSNLPSYRDAQLAFAAYIRNPDVNPAPADVEDRRMAIYRELFFNNIHSFLTNNFPIASSLFEPERWRSIVRAYYHRHAAESPYFLEIPQEFLAWLGDEPDVELPEFMLELCHYEWVELALDVSLDELAPETGAEVEPNVDQPFEQLALSPLAWPVSYRFPVHKIGPGYQPAEAPLTPTHLVVYRDRSDRVRFMESNPATHRLIQLIVAEGSVDQVIAALVKELGGGSQGEGSQGKGAQGDAPQKQIREHARQTLTTLVERDILYVI